MNSCDVDAVLVGPVKPTDDQVRQILNGEWEIYRRPAGFTDDGKLVRPPIINAVIDGETNKRTGVLECGFVSPDGEACIIFAAQLDAEQLDRLFPVKN